MPITPLHFGPSGLLGKILNRYLDVFSFIFVNIMIDIQPGLKLFFNIGSSIHGVTHTLLGGILIGLVTAIFIWLTQKKLDQFYQIFNYEYKANWNMILTGSIAGAWLHILIDSIIYSDVRPFYPTNFNPLYQLIPADYLNLIVILLSLIMLVYLIIIILNNAYTKK